MESQPVFVDPYGHRLRRLRHGVRVAAGAAVLYLALLALGLAGPATSPFSLLPGAGAKAGESGAEAVRTSSGTPSAAQIRDAFAAATLRGDVPGDTPDPAGTDPAAPGTPTAAAAPASSAPADQAPAASGAAPATPASSGQPSGPGSGQGSGHGSGPKSSPPPPSANPGPPAGHTPPGQAKKAGRAPGNGNGPPDNHGQQEAAQHSHSPNH